MPKVFFILLGATIFLFWLSQFISCGENSGVYPSSTLTISVQPNTDNSLQLSETPATQSNYVTEELDRGVIAIYQGNSRIYIGWRLLKSDPWDIAFNVYRGNTRINISPISSSTNFIDTNGEISSIYTIVSVVGGQEIATSKPCRVWYNDYLSIPLKTDIAYGANRVGVGDLDGDGDYDFLVKRGNADIDPSKGGGSTTTYQLEAYSNDGSFMWRRDLGWNIESGIWYSPVIVYDLDSDGKAEVITKTGPLRDYRDEDGRVLSGPEYFTIFDGETGELLDQNDWIERGSVSDWGDDYGNRVNRNLMCVAYLDGHQPSLVILRGTYAKMVAEAWDFRNGSLDMRWRWHRTEGSGNGFHNLRTGDIDNDGRDEIINGGIAIDDNGATLWQTKEGHGDRVHMTDIDPNAPGLEIWYIQEAKYLHPVHMRNAQTGSLMWGPIAKWGDVGRSVVADIDPAHLGLECWASEGPLYSASGNDIGPKPSSCNLAIWWDADVSRELLDGVNIDKWNNGTTNRLYTAQGQPGPRNAPMGYGDIFGDWREEVWYIYKNRELRVYTTTLPSYERYVTFMQDPSYRISVACEMMGYMQSTLPGFYFGN